MNFVKSNFAYATFNLGAAKTCFVSQLILV